MHKSVLFGTVNTAVALILHTLTVLVAGGPELRRRTEIPI